MQKSIENCLWQWDFCTPESLSYVLCPKGLALRRSKCKALCEPMVISLEDNIKTMLIVSNTNKENSEAHDLKPSVLSWRKQTEI